MTNFKVNTLLIGTQKAGTTSLFEYLKQHPDVFFSKIKEVTYFVDDRYYEKGTDYYHSFFDLQCKSSIVASAYVHMLPCRKCPERVFEYNPNMKFILLLRDPWSRAHSAFQYAVKNGWERRANTLSEALPLESERIERELYDLTYLFNGKYYEHLSHWLSFFDKRNFFITWDENLRKNPKKVMSELADFLGIDSSYQFDTSKQFNPSGGIRFRWLQHFLHSKENGLKTTFGKFLPYSLRVSIRSKLFSHLIQWNEISSDQINTIVTIPAEMNDHFKEDQRLLKKLLDE